MPGRRPRKKHYLSLRQRDNLGRLKSNSLLNDEGQEINDQNTAKNQIKPDSVSNTVNSILNDEGQKINDQNSAKNQIKPDSVSNTVKSILNDEGQKINDQNSAKNQIKPDCVSNTVNSTLNDEGQKINDQNSAKNQIKPDSVSNTVKREESKKVDEESNVPLNTEEIVSGNLICIPESTLHKDKLVRASKLQCLKEINEIAGMYQIKENKAWESAGKRIQRCEDLRKRASLRLASESTSKKRERLEAVRQKTSQRRMSESTDERRKRLRDQRQRASARLTSESPSERYQRLEEVRQKTSQRRMSESTDERRKRLRDQRQRASARLTSESTSERYQRLEAKRLKTSQGRTSETGDERRKRLHALRQRASRRLTSESPSERYQRLEEVRQKTSQRRMSESTDERRKRLQDQRQRASARLTSESTQERQERLEEQRRRQARYEMASRNQCPTYKSAVNRNVVYSALGEFSVECIHCKASHFPEERVSNRFHRDSFGDCCLHGRLLVPTPCFPNELVRLFLHCHPLSKEFHNRIRNLNSCFAFSSFNVSDERTINSHGIYSFIACGQVYHKMNLAAQPTQDTHGEFEKPLYGQMYFLDPDNAVEARSNHPLNYGISREIIEFLEHIIRAQNGYAQGYMMMREVQDEVNKQVSTIGLSPPEVQLLFRIPEESDYRRFNIPYSNEVCAVVTLNADQSFPENEMIVHRRNKEIIVLKNIDKRIEPFTYPLFYPQGTDGFSLDVALASPYSSRHHATRLEFAQNRLAFRREVISYLPPEMNSSMYDLRQTYFNALHFGGRLFQQYVVDTFIRVERDRIQWIKSNQKKILADNYTEVTRLINDLVKKNKATVGEKIILPSSFPGSTRYYTEHFEDAMAIVRRFGSPDFFITMTCNANWPEIKNALLIQLQDGSFIQQLPQDRPDVVTRVSKLKFHEIIEDFDKKQIFGKVAAYVYSIEFQKRGLPHMHLLLIMSSKDKVHNPEELDDLISAEIPDFEDTYLRELVLKWMIHNPCGKQNPNAPCMVNKNGHMKCRFHFPKLFEDVSSFADNSKPNYRRRYDPKMDPNHRDFSHERAVYRKSVDGSRTTRDNRHVIPYNPYLLKKYNCHINIEYVGSIMAVKYLYKYIYKGFDCASLKIVEGGKQIIYNEASTFIEGRCITPPEACWRLFGNEIQKKSHSVQRLSIHLPGQYRIVNLDQAQEDLVDVGQKGSTLEAYFKHNKKIKEEHEMQQLNGEIVEEPTYYYYWQMPEHFRWKARNSEWIRRMRRIKVVGRIHNVSFVAQPELYHMRLLLYHVKDATCFKDLLTVNKVEHATYKQACLARGLCYNDQQWIEGLYESASSKTCKAMRALFTHILILGSPENPKRLWELFKRDLAEDFIHEGQRTGIPIEDSIKRAYRVIAHKLDSEATEGRNFRYWVNKFSFDDIDNYQGESNQEMLNVDESTAIGQRMYQDLRGKQIEIVDAILHSVNEGNIQSNFFFIDGPAGTGKTFIYKTLYYLLSGLNYNVQCMAFTGIASVLLPGGRTSHKTFGLKVPLSPESSSTFKPESRKAQELSKIDIFLMDEAPMLPKYALHAIDEILRKTSNVNLPFGGKTMVLGGDFRQCLPVQPRANKQELIDLSIKKSALWFKFRKYSLDENMRVDPEQRDFAKYILKVGNGELPIRSLDEIELPENIISNGNLIDEVFGFYLMNENYDAMKSRAILAPLNTDVERLNTEIISKLPGDYKIYHSYDTVNDKSEGELQFTVDFLNSIESSDLPPHELKLKKNAIIMLLRNIDVSEGLCNGTRLIVVDLCNNIIKAKIITGERCGQDVHIPRITLESSKGQLGCTISRHQFPVKTAFAMTVHKSQGQTFDFVGVDLRTPVFMHGMLYVAFSRVKRKTSLKVLLPTENQRYTRNIVWKDILDYSRFIETDHSFDENLENLNNSFD